jgi:hypothetical protein
MITKQDLMDEQEQMQEDLRCFFDGLDLTEIDMDEVCQIVVDGMNRLIEKAKEE